MASSTPARNYKAEYRRRIDLNVRERGLTRKRARGFHAREARRLPDGTRARELSVSEFKAGRLAVGTIETMHKVNVGMNAGGEEGRRWRAYVRSAGWTVARAPKSGRLYTQDNVANDILERMTWRQRDYFFGY